MQRRTRTNPKQQKAGELNQRVTLLKPVYAVISGKTKTDWEEIATVWASVMPITGKEFFEAVAANYERSVWFTIRYRKGITEKLRLRHRGEDYEITTVINPGMANVKIEILATLLNGGAT